MPRTLYLLGPNLPREEAAELRRRLFPGRSVQVCNAAGHTPGQKIPGDVVVVGNYAPTIEQDAEGGVTRYKDMDALMASVQPPAQAPARAPARESVAQGSQIGTAIVRPAPAEAAARAPAPRQPPEPEPAPPHVAPTPTWDEPAKKKPLPDLEPMDRSALITLAAQMYPKQKPWATMRASAIRSALTELHQKRG